MDNGAVKIESSSPGERIVLLSLTSSLNDGNSHLLKVMYKSSKTYPELDGNREAFSVERTAPKIITDVLEGVLIGAHILHSKQFVTEPYKPLIGYVGDVFVNDNRLMLPDAVDIHNVFHGSCSYSDVWHSCLQWTDQSKPLSLGVVDNSNRISFLVSRDSLGALIHFVKKDSFDIEVTLTVAGIDVSSDDSEAVIIRPEADKSYFTLITITDGGSDVSVKAWDQSVSISYGGFWGFASKDLTTPHTLVIGESKDGPARTFTGSVSQFTIEDRFYELSEFSWSHNLMACERPQEDIQSPSPLTDTYEPFSCI
ncbi:unnamed protein product [Candidula unifasciata]|uniref:Uncharacterized protein n=1 Tax=Candidula unifasciata TaxID=100452 RepID=A0A8S3ZLR4_9EUPU|nr:unnamed protein product [Candidula unifasciata]